MNQRVAQRRALYAAACLSTALSSCGYLKYHEQEVPPPAGSQVVIPFPDGSPCVMAYIYQPAPFERDALTGALTEVCRIRRDPDFQALVAHETIWIAGCNSSNVPQHVETSTVVENVLHQPVPEVHFFTYHAFSPRTNAETDARRVAVVLDPRRVALWRSSDPTERSQLVDTLAHELTHLVRVSGGTNSIYTDNAACRHDAGAAANGTAGDLVSYKIGNLAGCWYEEHNPAPGATFSMDECRRQRVQLIPQS